MILPKTQTRSTNTKIEIQEYKTVLSPFRVFIMGVGDVTAHWETSSLRERGQP
jgi:hypothetical protein